MHAARTIVTSMAVILCLGGFTGCTGEENNDGNPDAEVSAPEIGVTRVNTGVDIGNEPLETTEGTTVIALDIDGMSCSGCATTITAAVTALPGVDAVRISLANDTGWVRVAKEGAASAEEISAIINEAGPTYAASLAGDEPASDDQADREVSESESESESDDR